MLAQESLAKQIQGDQTLARLARDDEDAPIEPEFRPDIVFIVGLEGRVLFVNRSLGQIAEDRVIGSSFYDWVFPEEHDMVREDLAAVFASGEPSGFELHGLQEAADTWFECRVTPNLREGRVLSATVIARDVTRHRTAEQALASRLEEVRTLLEERTADLQRAQNALAAHGAAQEAIEADGRRFRTLVDAAGEAIFVTSAATGEIVDVNETACRWLRRPRAEVVGRNAAELELEFAIQPPVEHDPSFTETRDTRRPLILSGGVQRRRDGSTFPVEVAVAHHTLGDREYVLAVARDVKERERAADALREADERYRALFEQTWDAVYVTARSGKITEVNGAAERLFGYARAAFVGLDAREILPRPDDVRAFRRAMAEEGHADGIEVEIRLADGRRLPALLSATRRLAANGDVKGYQCIVRPLETAREPAVAAAPPAPPSPPTPGAPEAPTLRASSGAEGERQGRPVVLVVDDDPATRDQARLTLERAGLTVVEAADPESAIPLARRHGAALMLAIVASDATAPGAPEAVRRIRHLAPKALVVFVTASDPLALAGEFADLGHTTYLRKPAHPLALVQAVRAAQAPSAG